MTDEAKQSLLSVIKQLPIWAVYCLIAGFSYGAFHFAELAYNKLDSMDERLNKMDIRTSHWEAKQEGQEYRLQLLENHRAQQ